MYELTTVATGNTFMKNDFKKVNEFKKDKKVTYKGKAKQLHRWSTYNHNCGNDYMWFDVLVWKLGTSKNWQIQIPLPWCQDKGISTQVA